MKTLHAGALALAASSLLALTGCASNEQWTAWRSHSSHFASGQHAAFSFRNRGEEARAVQATDPQKAREESWWGRPLPLAQRGGS
jgi:hypothetical protein